MFESLQQGLLKKGLPKGTRTPSVLLCSPTSEVRPAQNGPEAVILWLEQYSGWGYDMTMTCYDHHPNTVCLRLWPLAGSSWDFLPNHPQLDSGKEWHIGGATENGVKHIVDAFITLHKEHEDVLGKLKTCRKVFWCLLHFQAKLWHLSCLFACLGLQIQVLSNEVQRWCTRIHIIYPASWQELRWPRSWGNTTDFRKLLRCLRDKPSKKAKGDSWSVSCALLVC